MTVCDIHSDCRKYPKLGRACVLAGTGWAPTSSLPALVAEMLVVVNRRSRSATLSRGLNMSLSTSRTGPNFIYLRPFTAGRSASSYGHRITRVATSSVSGVASWPQGLCIG